MKILRMLSADEFASPIRVKPCPYPTTSLLSIQSAWRILRRRTGGSVSRATFYRWVSSGRLGSVRMGFRIFVPLAALDDFIRKCLKGE